MRPSILVLFGLLRKITLMFDYKIMYYEV
jgi:hypothetical protein